MPTTEALQTVSRFRRLSPVQEVDERGNMPASSAFELVRQVGKDSDVFWIGLALVQKSSYSMSLSENVDPEARQKFIALVLAVLSLGEHQLSIERKGDIPMAVQYLRDVYARHKSVMNDDQAEEILSAVFDGKKE